MVDWHSLLKRQLKRHLDGDYPFGGELVGLVQAVNDAYVQSDADRLMMERALDISSEELLEANSELRAIIQAFPDLFFNLDETGRILQCKAGAQKDLLRPAEELIGRKIQAVPDPDAATALGQAIDQVRATGSIVSAEYSLTLPEEEGWYEARLLPLREGEILMIVRNISEQEESRKQQAASLSLFKATLESTADGILVISRDGQIEICNQQFREMWHLPAEGPVSISKKETRGQILDQLSNPETFLATVENIYSRPETESHDRLHFKDGRIFERYSRPQRIDSECVGRVWSFRDVTKRVSAEAEVRRLAYYDDLTDLPNRTHLNRELKKALPVAGEDSRMLALLFMDLIDSRRSTTRWDITKATFY